MGVIELTGTRRRQPGLIAGGLLLVAVAALGGALLFGRLASTITVLVAAREIGPGEVVAESDLRAVELTNLGPAATIGVEAQGRILGRVSRGSIPAGTVLNEDLFAARESVVPSQMAVVGAALDPGAAPGPGLRPGDRVDVLAVERSAVGLEATSDGEADVIAGAVVWSVDDSGSAVGARLVVSLLVPLEAQTSVAQAAADNRLRLSLTGR